MGDSNGKRFDVRETRVEYAAEVKRAQGIEAMKVTVQKMDLHAFGLSLLYECKSLIFGWLNQLEFYVIFL
jgi:hypothetical protein